MGQLETVAGDAVLSARAELIQEFKDGKRGEWDPDYWIRLARGEDEAKTAEEPMEPVDGDQVRQRLGGDAPADTSSAPIVEIIDQSVTEQSSVAD